MREYKNKKILITGNTGFKGTWLTLTLKLLGANIVGYSDKRPKKKAMEVPCGGDCTSYRLQGRASSHVRGLPESMEFVAGQRTLHHHGCRSLSFWRSVGAIPVSAV